MLVSSLSPRGRAYRPRPISAPLWGVPSWAYASGGQTKGAEMFH